MGFKRSEARMHEIEIKLRRGMEQNNITGETQDKIVQAITSFALYGFPESHAASFALLAYASAYLKCHYLAAFTAALLNNQPMGFYHPATIIKDAQRHGLKINPIDVTRSDWLCTLEERVRQTSVCRLQQSNLYRGTRQTEVCRTPNAASPAMRLGLRYVKGLREEPGRAIVLERAKRPFEDIDDLHNRVPELRKDEMRKLAEVGALNFIRGQKSEIRGQMSQIGNRQSTIGNSFIVAARSGRSNARRARSGLCTKNRGKRGQGTGYRFVAVPCPLSSVPCPLSPVTSPLSPLRPMTIEERVNIFAGRE